MTKNTEPAGLSSSPEPTVQVPVSLIKRAVQELFDATGREALLVCGELHALLSQPTLTAEAVDREGYDRYLEEYASETEVPMSLAQWQEATVEPPRIEDMAPGTTFRARLRTSSVEEQFTKRTRSVMCEDGDRWPPRAIDPSTIRDVTPPTQETK